MTPEVPLLLEAVGGSLPPIPVVLMLAVIALALVLFIWEPIPLDVTAIAVLVLIMALEPWTEVDVQAGLSGFQSTATITVLAMFVLSDGIRRTGIISVIGRFIANRYGTSPTKQLGAVLGLSGITAGFINNTPVVAVMIPMVEELSAKTGISPSKLLMPISFAAMMGGMLTLIGTSTNLLASDVYDRMGTEFEPFTMFEFTQLGAIVLAVGIIYLMTIGRYLVPDRGKREDQLTKAFNMSEYLTEVVVTEDSNFVGKSLSECIESLDLDADVVQLIRENAAFSGPVGNKVVEAGDIIVLRTDRESLITLIEDESLGLAPDAVDVDDDELEAVGREKSHPEDHRLIEVIIPPESALIGDTLVSSNFRNRYGATVLAIRRGEQIIRARMDERTLRAGDLLLLQTTNDSVKRFNRSKNFVVVGEFEVPEYRKEKLPIAIGIIALVVALPGLGIVPIVHSALGGMVAMVVTGCLKPGELYDAVDWSVIFLLAGLIPLGVAMEATGTAEYLAAGIVGVSGELQPIIILGLLYLFTAIVTQAVTNNASVVLLIPIAVDTAISIGADPFAFALAVTFAASTAFMTPVGYQTNLMVYGPGGYKFADYARVGIPLQLILAVVTAVGIAVIWGV